MRESRGPCREGRHLAMRALVRRFGVYLLAAWAAVTVSFLLPRVVPGNPAAGAVARASQSGNWNAHCVRALELQLGYNVHSDQRDMYQQYIGKPHPGVFGPPSSVLY